MPPPRGGGVYCQRQLACLWVCLLVFCTLSAVLHGASSLTTPAPGQIGNSCNAYDASPCEDPHASCNAWSSICECDYPYQQNSAGQNCVPNYGYPGGGCSAGDNSSCSDPNAYCGEDSLCHCVGPFQPRDKENDIVCAFTECGGELTTMSGSIASPQLGSIPAAGTECVWTIAIDSDTHVLDIQGQLNSFQWEPNCPDAFVEIREEVTDPTMGSQHVKQCETTSIYMRTSGTQTTVRFFVTPSQQNSSFVVTWSSVCEIRLKQSGTIRSPRFPDSYPAQQHCTYYFDNIYDYAAQLTFTAFNIPNATDSYGESCAGSDYVHVSYRDNNWNYHYDRFCGTELPPDIRNIHDGYLKFHSGEARGAGYGFEAVYTKQLRCYHDDSVNSNQYRQGYLDLPGYNPDQIEGSCTQTITVNENSIVLLHLEVNFYSMTESATCQAAYVKVYDGPTKDENNLLGTFCDRTYDFHLLASTSNSLVIEYYTDGSIRDSYSYAEYFAVTDDKVCSDLALSGPEGSISLHSDHSWYTAWIKNGICRWTITVDEGFAIQLAFERFSIDIYTYNGDSLCDDSSLTVYDGLVEQDSAVIGKLCAYDQPWLMTSTGNSIVVTMSLGHEGGYTRAGLIAYYKAVDGAQVNRNCGDRTLTGTGGVIMSPNFPANYDNLLDCEWLITVDEAFVVQINTSHFRLESSSNCMYDSVQVRNGNNLSAPYLLHPFCDYYGHYYGTLTSETNEVLVKFVSNWETNSTGFSATWSRVCQRTIYDISDGGTLQSPYYPNNYPNDIRCDYTVYYHSPGTRLVFSFSSLNLEPGASDGSCVNDYVEITEQQHWSDTTGAYGRQMRFCGNILPDEYVTFFNTRVTFVSNGDITASGYQLSYRLVNNSDCGTTLYTGERGTVTTPNYPGSFPPMVNCTNTIQVSDGETVTLTFEDWNMGSFWGAGTMEGDDCRQMLEWNWVNGAVLEIFDGDTVDPANVLGIYCGMGAPLTITSTSNALTLVFSSFYNWDMYTGFSATYTSSQNSSMFTDCGGEVTGTGGVITSPAHPEHYPNNSVCEWVITGDPGDTIRLSFEVFSLQDSDSCQMDSLEIRDGNTELAPRLDRVCGDAVPLDVTSTGNTMHLKFVSDFDVSSTGFKASWVSLCEEIFRTSSGTITSPGNHGNPKQCTYIIEQREWSSWLVRLTFTHFFMGDSSTDCSQNYVEVRDGGFEISPLIGRYCGNDLPPVLESSHNMMWIRYVTDGAASTVGFSASYSLERPTCGKVTLTEKSGTFASPFHPNDYPNAVNCTWEIVAPTNHKVKLTFNSFLLEGPSPRCYWDWVKVIDGTKEIGKYCGVSVPDTITSTGNTLTVVLHTDWVISFEGFTASYISYDPASDELTRQYDLYPFGTENGDEQLSGPGQKPHVTVKTGFPVGSELEYKVFISKKGAVSFGYRETGKKFDLRLGKKMICTYNGDILDKGGPINGTVFYQLRKDAAVLAKASAEVREFTELKDYTASLVLVVTWYRVQHVSCNNPDDERATVQLALISDGQRSFALVYYKSGEMNWPYMYQQPLKIGVSDGVTIVENIYSMKEEAFTSLDTIPGNTGRQGMWIYDIGDSYSADQACQDWYDRNLLLDSERQKQFGRLPECPCSLWFLWGNWRWSHYRHGYDVMCFRMTVGSSRSVAPHGKECCYSAGWWDWFTYGQYQSDAPHAGSATAYNPAFWSLRADYMREDRQAHDICCYNTTSSEYCDMYYELRPIGECTTRIPFRFSFTWGDPHIKTLDGGEYTFNGWGEYIMISLTTSCVDFMLQGRTGPAVTESGTTANATVFTAFGAQVDGVTVTVDLDPNTNETLIIFGNGTDYTTDFYGQGNDFEVENEAFLLSNSNGSCIVKFTACDTPGIQLNITVGFKSLDISIVMPEDFSGQTKGLLGNFNGVQGDDFVLPDGTALASDLTERQIYEQFGPQWSVSESNTVLRYPPREGPADYAHPEFQPIFLDEQPADVIQAAEDLCGATNIACVYDYVATGSEAMATSTKNTADNANNTEAISKNTVPVLKFNGTLSVTSGSAATFNLQGHDPDAGDTLTYYVMDDAGGSVQVDSATGDVTVTLDASTPVALSFYAVDSNNVQSPKRDVTVIVCPSCNSHGTCDVTNAVATNVIGFMIAPCVCDPAWTGSDCSDDYDACEENPCSAQQSCTDLTPDEQGDSETGFACTACDNGFQADPDDPTSCIDIDECALNHNCTGLCINLPGTYECGCEAGYRLSEDGMTCDDINECADRTAGCQQDCVNTKGSFNCTCFPGYTLSSKGACEPDQTTADLCSLEGCQHGCTVTTDPDTGGEEAMCFCNVGYKKNPANETQCVDVDECSEGFCSQGCTNTIGSFACTCYTGHQLGTDQRTCTPCEGLRYGPECRLTCACNGHASGCDHVTGCICTSGWTGSHCEHDVDECAENPDVCGSDKICVNTLGSYMCNCPAGYTKNSAGNCEDIDECAEDYLESTCGELETCHNVEGSYYCSCISGYTRKNGQCVDVDECAGSAQKCHHICINRPGSFNCDCYYGFRLDQERTHCIQVGDVCKEFEGLECDQGCTISDETDRAVCFCEHGYILAGDGQTCLDEDECTSGTASCSHTCINTPGAFSCSCPVGMKLDNDGKTCQDCPTGFWGEDCNNTCSCGIGSTGCDAATGCVCQTGWTGTHCDQDVNECDTEAKQLECQAINGFCYNFRGGYRCQCQGGYSKNSEGVCEDVDECANSPCGQLCENLAGSYRCLCNKGYKLDSTTEQCQDIDECSVSILNECSQQCINTPGGYRCACDQQGFELQNDGVTCQATTTCTRTDCPTENGGCSEEQCFCNNRYQLSSDQSTCEFVEVDPCTLGVCEQNCVPGDSTSYTCSCNDGYLLNNDKSTCRGCPDGTFGPRCNQTCSCNTMNTQSCSIVDGTCTCKAGWEGVTCNDDINECNTVTCPDHATCVNTRGSHLCSCDAGYSKVDGNCAECDANHYGVNCAERCECSVNSVSCDKVSGACTCKAGWEGAHCDVDVDECTTGAHDCSGSHVECVNNDGGFSCRCEQGYTLNGTECVDKDECFTKENNCVDECTNTVGGYTCSCGRAYVGTGNDCRELERVPVVLWVNISVPASELTNPNSQAYKDWVTVVETALFDKAQSRVPGLTAVIVLSLRPGSLVADVEYVVDTQTEPNSLSALSAVILTLIQEQITLGSYTGSVAVNISGLAVNNATTVCDVYTQFEQCDEGESCQEENGEPTCVGDSPEDSDDDDIDLTLIIALAVAIPAAILIAFGVGVFIYIKNRPTVQTMPLVNYDEVYSIAPAPANLYGDKSKGPADTRMRAPSPISASPVPSLDSILPDMETRPPSRKASWTDGI